MQRVHLMSRHNVQLAIDFTPGRRGVVDGVEFLVSKPEGRNWICVFDDAEDASISIPVQRRILVITEPPGIKTYWPEYLNQFGIVITPFELTGISGEQVLSQPCIGWYYGVDFSVPGGTAAISYEELVSSRPVPKKANLSAVLSGKTTLPLHRRRLEFAHLLKARLGERFQIFGHGFRSIDDKREAIDPYRYHLAIENSVVGHYWTEKLSDGLLGWALPIYCGAPAASQYFPDGAFIPLNLDDLDTAVQAVDDILCGDPYNRHLEKIGEARRRVLETYSLPATIARVIRQREGGLAPALSTSIILRSNAAFEPVAAKVYRNLGKLRRSIQKRLRSSGRISSR